MSKVVAFSLAVFCWASVLVRSYPEVEIVDCVEWTDYGSTFCNEETLDWCEWNTKYSFCDSTDEVVMETVFVDYYDLAISGFWLIVIPGYCFLFLLISQRVTSHLIYKNMISESYYEKIVIYIFELMMAVPIYFKIFYPIFIYDPVFNPNDYSKGVKPQVYNDLYGSLTFVCGSLCMMYFVEMSFARNMRWQLKLHHWVTIFGALLTCISVNQRASIDLWRAGLSMTLYATTESHIFLQLLMYRMFPQKWPVFHYLSSYLYLFTRMSTMVLFFVCYVEWCVNWGDFIVSNDPFDIGWCYALWFWVSPVANLLLNFAQYSSVKALFYVATKVFKNERQWKRLGYHRRIRELHDIYISYDDVNHDGEWSVRELDAFLTDCCRHDRSFVRSPQIVEFLHKTLLHLQETVIRAHKRRRGGQTKRPKKGIIWETVLYLFQSELTYLSENLSTQQIVRAKLRLLSYGAHQAFRTKTGRHLMFDDEDASASEVLGKQALKLRNISSGDREQRMQKLVSKFARDIEVLTDNAIEDILNISMKHKTGQRRREATLQLLNKLEQEISKGKFEEKYNPKHWCLVCLRCVVCRHGCRKEQIIRNARDIRRKKSIYHRVSDRFKRGRSRSTGDPSAGASTGPDGRGGEGGRPPKGPNGGGSGASGASGVSGGAADGTDSTGSSNASNGSNASQGSSNTSNGNDGRSGNGAHGAHGTRMQVSRTRVSDTSPITPDIGDITDAKGHDDMDLQPLKQRMKNAISVDPIEESHETVDTIDTLDTAGTGITRDTRDTDDSDGTMNTPVIDGLELMGGMDGNGLDGFSAVDMSVLGTIDGGTQDVVIETVAEEGQRARSDPNKIEVIQLKGGLQLNADSVASVASAATSDAKGTGDDDDEEEVLMDLGHNHAHTLLTLTHEGTGNNSASSEGSAVSASGRLMSPSPMLHLDSMRETSIGSGASESEALIDSTHRKRYFSRLNTANIGRLTPSQSMSKKKQISLSNYKDREGGRSQKL